ncbi:SAM-dependent methyltransferase [Saccharopolyspora sp. 5N708]|uniref:SAM-dependent methyltransferase n=1 Tax=Saccharopolyspora sp. 5N708 TaxID=3457424 RepID=UPI003FCF1D91
MLGGEENFDVDRAAIHAMTRSYPESIQFALENRAFLQRVVRYLAAEAGIRQFIDNGSGLPTQRNVHQVAQEVDPNARVVYVDNDPTVLARGRALLADNGNTVVLRADMSKPEQILTAESTRELIDFDEPVAALYVSVLHCLPDAAQPEQVVTRMLDALPAGSYLVISHVVSDDKAIADEFTEFMTSRSQWGRMRLPAEVARYFDGLEILEPGLVDIATWRPEPASELHSLQPPFEHLPVIPAGQKKTWEFGGVARKP